MPSSAFISSSATAGAEKPRVDIAGVAVDTYDIQETLDVFEALMREPGPHHHAGVNASKVVDCGKDERFARIIAEADIVNPDGMSVVWASKMLGTPVPERVTGVDIIEGMLELSARNGWSVFLLGARPEVIEEAAANVRRQFPDLVLAGFRNGYWEKNDIAEQEVVREVRESGADVLFLGIPSPAKEYFYDTHRHELGVGMVVGVGGTFDVLAGHVRRAPALVQKVGMEWSFRLIQEPRRLWRRYLFGNSEFIREVWRQKTSDEVRTPADTTPVALRRLSREPVEQAS